MTTTVDIPPLVTWAEVEALDVPRDLYPRPDGTPQQHLSYSQVGKWERCPEQFRQHYLLGHHEPVGGALMLGSALDDALSAAWDDRLAGTVPDADALVAGLDERLTDVEDQSAARGGVIWEDGERDALLARGRELIPVYLGLMDDVPEPRETQRKLRWQPHPEANWDVVGYLDLDCAHEVRDLKTTRRAKSRQLADADRQVTTYLMLRSLAGEPAERFVFECAITDPAKPAEVVQVATTRSADQLRAEGLRYVVAARAIRAMLEGLGPDTPWPTTGYGHAWACRFCGYRDQCPAIVGIPAGGS